MKQQLALFASARKVVMADDLCREASLSTVVIHVPKEYSSECGMCLRIAANEIETFERLMGEAGITYQLYPYENI